MDPSPGSRRPTFVHETVFAIFFATMVALEGFHGWRRLDGSMALWLLFILSENFVFLLEVRKRPPTSRVATLHALANSLAVFGVIRETGGRESLFWVAFLLPVLAASVCQTKGGPWSIVALDAAMLSLLYLPAVDRFDVIEWLMKAGTLAFAAAVTHRAKQAENGLRRRIDEKRLHLEYLATRMVEDHGPVENPGDLFDRVERRLKLIENPLAVLEGSLRLAELSAPEAKPDLKRIEACHRMIRAVSQDLFEILYGEDYWFEPVAFEEVYAKAVQEMRYPLAVKEIVFVENVEPELPPIPMSRLHVEQVLHAALGRAAIASNPRDTIEVSARMAGLEDEPYLEVAIVHAGTGEATAMPHLRRIVERHGGWFRFEYLTRNVRYTFAFPLHRGVRLTPP